MLGPLLDKFWQQDSLTIPSARHLHTTMGCKQSKHSLVIDVQPQATIDAVECTGMTDTELPVEAEPTPRDIRRIRDELFSKDSLLAIASATTADTAASNESLDPLQFGAGLTRFLNDDTASQTTKSTRDNYHYPMALYEEMMGVRHFVPATQKAASYRCDNYVENESIISGMSQLDISERSLRGFSQIEHLADTMSLSGRVNSFGNLVDTLTDTTSVDEEYLDSDGTETFTAEQANLGCSLPPRHRRHSRHSSTPRLEQKLSSESMYNRRERNHTALEDASLTNEFLPIFYFNSVGRYENCGVANCCPKENIVPIAYESWTIHYTRIQALWCLML